MQARAGGVRPGRRLKGRTPQRAGQDLAPARIGGSGSLSTPSPRTTTGQGTSDRRNQPISSTPPHLHCLRRASSSFPWLCFLTRSSSGFHFASDFCWRMAL